MRTNSYFSLPTVSDSYGRVRAMRPSTIGYIGQDETSAPVDLSLLFPGLALLAIGMFFLGGKHEPQRKLRRSARKRKEEARELRKRAKALESESGILGFI